MCRILRQRLPAMRFPDPGCAGNKKKAYPSNRDMPLTQRRIHTLTSRSRKIPKRFCRERLKTSDLRFHVLNQQHPQTGIVNRLTRHFLHLPHHLSRAQATIPSGPRQSDSKAAISRVLGTRVSRSSASARTRCRRKSLNPHSFTASANGRKARSGRSRIKLSRACSSLNFA